MTRLPTLYIARHCTSEWNIQRKLQGTQDPPLSTKGREEAHTNFPQIAHLGIECIYTSPAKRALETAEIYAVHFAVPLNIHDGFRELDHGDWEGKSFDQILQNPETNFKAWLTNPAAVPIPGGSETIESAQQRVVGALCDIVVALNGRTALIVTHKHIRALLRCALEQKELIHFQNPADAMITPAQIPPEQLRRLCKRNI